MDSAFDSIEDTCKEHEKDATYKHTIDNLSVMSPTSWANLKVWKRSIFERLEEMQEDKNLLLLEKQWNSMHQQIVEYCTHHQRPLALVRLTRSGKMLATMRMTVEDTIELYIRSGGTLQDLHPLSLLVMHKPPLQLEYTD